MAAPPSQNTWSLSPGPSAFDLRSDTITYPTPSMLHALQTASLADDVFSESSTTNALQARVSSLLAKPAALLTTSGTLANQLALRTLLPAPPAGLLADARSHVLAWEAGGAAWISGALAQPVAPADGVHLTLDDVKKHAVVDDDVHSCPTRVIALENTLGGVILPLRTAQDISAWARAQDPPIAMHLDGARLWEAVAAGAGSLEDYASCFDTISLCFSKGLGAPVGSILVGSERDIARARHLRKALGGGMRMAGIVSGPARAALEDTFVGGLLAGSHKRTREFEAVWKAQGGKVLHEVQTNMVWCDLDEAGVTKEEFVRVCGEEGLNVLGGRLVVHYQIGEEALGRWERVAGRILGGGRGGGS